MANSRNIFKRHPFVFGFMILVIVFFAFARWAELTEPPYKKLDYTKPIATAEGAIICPQSLLLDMRLDHSPGAIFSAFTSISNRTEKVHAIGCEELRGDLPVLAHRLSTPNESYVSVTFLGAPAVGELFTMEADLKNVDVYTTPSNASAPPLQESPVKQPEPSGLQTNSQDAKPLPTSNGDETPTPEQQPPAPIVREPPPQK